MAFLPCKPIQNLQYLVANDGVHPGHGFIQKEQLRVMGQSNGQANFFFIPREKARKGFVKGSDSICRYLSYKAPSHREKVRAIIFPTWAAVRHSGMPTSSKTTPISCFSSGIASRFSCPQRKIRPPSRWIISNISFMVVLFPRPIFSDQPHNIAAGQRKV